MRHFPFVIDKQFVQSRLLRTHAHDVQDPEKQAQHRLDLEKEEEDDDDEDEDEVEEEEKEHDDGDEVISGRRQRGFRLRGKRVTSSE